jgi:ubiquinone/menaquinone biosynthesis C-methylase UbiE
MSHFLREKFEKLTGKLLGTEKRDAEVRFWKKEILKYIQWYDGNIPELYGNRLPEDKVIAPTKAISAILTFFNVHQKHKYLKDLMLEKDSFTGMKVLDIGCGPFPSALCFEGAEVFSLDPLLDSYISAGYPVHCYEQRGRFVHSSAEHMPFFDQSIDAVISVNAIDHVDDFAQTAREIRRVLKPDGRFRMHVHYHPKTTAEPIELNDEVFLQHYGWVSGIKKLRESKQKVGSVVEDDRELYVVWGN